LVHLFGHDFDAFDFWTTLLVIGCVVVLAVAFYTLYILIPARRRARAATVGKRVMRRDMDRMAEYFDGLRESLPAVRQPFELGLAAMKACDWDQAVGHFREAMMQARGAEIVALFNLTGMCRYTQGLLDDSLANFEEAARLAAQFEEEEGRAPALGNIGVIWHDRGELDRALQYKEKALATAHALGDQWAEATYIANIGNVWHDKGDLDKALECHKQALELSRDLGDRWGVAGDLAGIAGILRDKGSLDEALRYDQEALAMARKLGHRLGVAADLGNIASIYRYKGELDEALKRGEEALAVARKIGYRLGVAADLGNIGLILTDQRKYGQAVPKLGEALTILLASGVADGPRQVVGGLARCEDKLGRERVEKLLREAGLDDRSAADLLDRVDQMRRKKPEPKRRRPVRF
jgi:tetratricopeptide (TPR) repeat protein